MNVNEVERLLKDVKNGKTSIEEALDVLKNFLIPILDLQESITTGKFVQDTQRLFTVLEKQSSR